MFGDRAKQVPISSTKSMLGHTLGAAGAVEAIVSVLAIINQKVPPTINMSLENNRYGLDFVPNRARDKQIDIVLSNSFAFGGNNATVILRKYEQDKSYPNVQVNKKEKVVITGIGAVQPLGIGKDELYTAIANEERAIKRFSFNEDYHSLLGASAPEESYINFVHPSFRRRIDQLGKLSLASSKQALEDAKLKITRDNNCRIAVFFGTGTGPIETVEKVNRSIIIEGEDSVNPSLFPNTVMNAAAGYVCLAHQIKGPSTTICSGGVSGSQAMIYAYQWIKEGIIDAALVIASDEYHEVLHAGYDRLGVLSDTNPNPFDRNSNGFVLSGGSVALLLESESHARHRSASIYAEIKGFGITSDAYRIAGNHPFGKSYTLAIKEALRESEIDFEHIDGIFTDARGTPMIDLIEGRAISKLSRKEVPVTSLAGKNGYAVGGLTPLHTIAAIQAMETGKLPGLSVKNPVIQLKFAVSQKRLSKADFFLINSSAFGGTYTSIVLGKLER
jgi:3-oxoacyl-[acyl-carrier-protein] synthase II